MTAKLDPLQVAGVVVGALGVGVTIFSLVRSSSAPSGPSQPDRWIDPGQSFLLLGDSLGVGLQKYLNERSNAYGSKMTSLVKSGSTAAYWNTHIQPGDAGYHAIVLSLGSNDAALPDPESEGPQLDALLEKLSARGAHILWFLPPSFHPDALTAKQATFVEMMKSRGVTLLDLLGPQPSVMQDPMHLHLTPDGYRVLASQIFDALTRT